MTVARASLGICALRRTAGRLPGSTGRLIPHFALAPAARGSSAALAETPRAACVYEPNGYKVSYSVPSRSRRE